MGGQGLTSRLRALLPTLELALAALAGALWYMQGGAIWFRGGGVLWQPLALVGALWGLRALQGRPFQPRALDLLLALLLCSALVSAWAAYDRERALAKLGLIVGAWALYSALAHQPDLQRLYPALALWGVAGVALAVYFVAAHDWSAPAKVAVLGRLGATLAARLPHLPGHAITPNVAGGMLALLLPLYAPLIGLPLVGALGGSRRARWALAALWGLAGLLALGGWALSASRGAWAAGLGALALWLGWRALGRLLPEGDNATPVRRGTACRAPTLDTCATAPAVDKRSLPIASGEGDLSRPWRARVTAFALALAAGAILAALVAAQMLRAGGPGAQALANRWMLAQQGLTLARDYPFTGLGLGMFEMHFSVYTLLIHVGYIVNSHNALLDLLIEQGAPGLALWLGAVLVAVASAFRALRWASPERRLLLEAALASLAAGLLHGLVDDVLYGSRGLLLWFLPLGIIAAVVGWEERRPREVSEPPGGSSEGSLARGEPRSAVLRAADAGGDARAPQSSPQTARPSPASRERVAVCRRVSALPWIVGGALILALALANGRTLAAAWQANLGALEQARRELNAYDQRHFDDPTIDLVRQRADLSAPLARFERALALRPGQATASQRLAAIALARGEYARARALMEACAAAGHADAPTRLLLGDAWVATGQPRPAAALVAGLPFAQSRLEGQAWSRYHQRGQAAQEADANLAARLIQQYEAERALGAARP